MNLWAIQFAWDPGMKMPETRRTWGHECVVVVGDVTHRFAV